MMLVDSNIIVYALNSSSSKHRKAKKFLEENSENLSISHQDILESIRVLTHKNFSIKIPLDTVLKEIFKITQSCSVILPNQTAILLAFEFVKKYTLRSDQIFDAYLAATAINNNISVIATDNEKDFRKINEIKVFNPFKNGN